MKKITVTNIDISISVRPDNNDYICLTDMAHFKDRERTNYIIQNWMRLRSTIDFLGLWEKLNNPNFKGIEFDAFKMESGTNSFTYNPQIQISAESETKRSIFREKDKTKRSKKESAQHSKSRNKSFVMTSVSAL